MTIYPDHRGVERSVNRGAGWDEQVSTRVQCGGRLVGEVGLTEADLVEAPD